MNMLTSIPFRFKILILALFFSLVISNPGFAGEIQGFVDSVTLQGSNIVVNGWACDGTDSALNVDVYTGTAEKAGNLIQEGNVANVSRPDLQDACGSIGHGYAVVLTADQLKNQTDQMIWVGSSGTFLKDSGRYSIPQNSV